ncbi:MAG: CrcB protein [Flavobacteriales bacterium]|jgi:CrcB protein
MPEMLRLALAVGIGGFFGAVARFGTTALAGVALGSRWPVGTFVANCLGCLLLGWLRPWQVGGGSAMVAALVLTGFCGSYTTFSTFMLESHELTVAHGARAAAVYVASSVLMGAIFVGIGMRLGAPS